MPQHANYEGVTISRDGTTTLRFDGDREPLLSDRYAVRSLGPEGQIDRWTFDAIRIGCPRCKTNTRAVLQGYEYHCYCGYSHAFDPVDAPLMQVTSLNEDSRYGVSKVIR